MVKSLTRFGRDLKHVGKQKGEWGQATLDVGTIHELPLHLAESVRGSPRVGILTLGIPLLRF